MKTGDKVRVTRLLCMDTRDTNLQLGTTGIISREVDGSDGWALYTVDFGIDFVSTDNANITHDGYYMFDDQLELVV